VIIFGEVMSLPVSRDMVLDPGTFGGSKVCHVIVDMMNHGVISIREKHKVLSLINDVNIGAKYLSEVSHPGVRNHAMRLTQEHYIAVIDKKDYPDKFKSHLKNVINSIFKKNLVKAMRVEQAIAR
jgi:hypothetical protein